MRIFCDICIGLNILINLNSAYIVEEFIIVDDRLKIIKNYLISWLIIDFLSIIPFDVMLNLQNSGNIYVRFIRIPRILRMLKLKKIIAVYKDN